MLHYSCRYNVQLTSPTYKGLLSSPSCIFSKVPSARGLNLETHKFSLPRQPCRPYRLHPSLSSFRESLIAAFDQLPLISGTDNLLGYGMFSEADKWALTLSTFAGLSTTIGGLLAVSFT